MKRLIVIPALLFSFKVFSQSDRQNDHNNVNWGQVFNNIQLGKRWSIHLEYQWRRASGLKSWQQGLLRAGVNYRLHDNVLLHAGYGWIETFPYGDHPIASAGTFPEHRLYEQISFRQPLNKWIFSHRFRIEQRWLGKVKPGSDRIIEEWVYLHRFRYQFRTQYAVWAKKEKQFYGVLADEIFIGAGKNLGVNIFDQNRILVMAGYRFNKRLAVEGGYFNQVLQQGRKINDKTIIQRNNGIVLASYINL